MASTILNLGPKPRTMQVLPPRLHPGVTNVVVAISGSTDTYVLQENVARTIATILTLGTMTVLLQQPTSDAEHGFVSSLIPGSRF